LSPIPDIFYGTTAQHAPSVLVQVLVSTLCQAQSTVPTGSATPVLNHPVLQYHYPNDSPFPPLPRSLNEQILVLDYDPDYQPFLTLASGLSNLN
jgi:hypothetical protein